jgi:hypothetical protein
VLGNKCECFPYCFPRRWTFVIVSYSHDALRIAVAIDILTLSISCRHTIHPTLKIHMLFYTCIEFIMGVVLDDNASLF